MVRSAASTFSDGLIAVVKEDCPTCRLVAPVLRQMADSGAPLTVYTQDDLSFPPGVSPVDDTELAVSYALEIETVPALLRVEDGEVVASTVGWWREQWEALTGIEGLGVDLPD